MAFNLNLCLPARTHRSYFSGMEVTADVPAIISPPENATSFTVNEVTYTQTDSLAIGRLRVFQRYAIEIGLDATLKAFIGGVDEVWKNLNEGKLANGIHELGKIRDGLNIVGANRLRDVEICALFFNAPGENPAMYDHAQQQKKCYQDWASVAGGFFFHSALRLLSASLGSYGPGPTTDPSKTTDEASAPDSKN